MHHKLPKQSWHVISENNNIEQTPAHILLLWISISLLKLSKLDIIYILLEIYLYYKRKDSKKLFRYTISTAYRWYFTQKEWFLLSEHKFQV